MKPIEFLLSCGWIFIILIQLGFLALIFLVARALWIHFDLGNLI
jgi:hypothetical protein